MLKTAMVPETYQLQQQRLTEQKELFCLFNTKQLFLIDAWFQQCHRERTVVYFVLLAHRGIGEKTKERRIGVDLASFTGKTETEKPNAMVSDAETEADNQNEH